jgi:hypothetical protein
MFKTYINVCSNIKNSNNNNNNNNTAQEIRATLNWSNIAMYKFTLRNCDYNHPLSLINAQNSLKNTIHPHT